MNRWVFLKNGRSSFLARFKSTSCGTTLLKSKQPTYHPLRKKTKSLDLTLDLKLPQRKTNKIT